MHVHHDSPFPFNTSTPLCLFKHTHLLSWSYPSSAAWAHREICGILRSSGAEHDESHGPSIHSKLWTESIASYADSAGGFEEPNPDPNAVCDFMRCVGPGFSGAATRIYAAALEIPDSWFLWSAGRLLRLRLLSPRSRYIDGKPQRAKLAPPSTNK